VASPDTRTPGERARARREALKIDRRVFAGLVGMPYSTLADWENGRIVNTAKVPIHVIAEQLQTSAEWLLSGRGSADAREVRDAPPVALADRQTFWGFDLTRDAAELGWEWQKLSAEERDALAEVIRTLVKRRKEAEVKPGKRKRAPAESRAQA
jgi:transcriptional regulator with XRE-family HTH domain